MNNQSYGIQWLHAQTGHVKRVGNQLIVKNQTTPQEVLLDASVLTDGTSYHLVTGGDSDVHSEVDIDQIAAENLIFMARDGQVVTEIYRDGALMMDDSTAINAVLQETHNAISSNEAVSHERPDCVFVEEYVETTPQMVTEEVITDDWVQHQGEERVEIPAEQITSPNSPGLLAVDVPLRTVQDEYARLRPYPCDFCSRRFRAKKPLQAHLDTHKRDRPYLCKLCGARFFRRNDLINHLKAHANLPDTESETDYINFVVQDLPKQVDQYYENDWNDQDNSIMHTMRHDRKPPLQHVMNGFLPTSTSTSGRTSRLKSLDENYALSDNMRASHGRENNHIVLDGATISATNHQTVDDINVQSMAATIEQDAVHFIDSQQLHAASTAVKITQNNVPTPEKSFPVLDESKPFVCQQCGLAFAREKAMLSHSKNHRSDLPYECNLCNELFWDAPGLQEHQKAHRFEDSNSEYDPAEAEADETQSGSESERSYGVFYCSECGMSFHREELLRRHSKAHLKDNYVDEMDVNKDRHCCNTCGESFSEALDLLAHAEIHARYPPFKCVLCGDTFFEEHTIKRHLQNIHANEMTTNSCILCGKECRDRRALIKHAWDHSREKCHSCSKCGKSFHNKARLKRHMVSHRDKSVTCDVCHEEFPDGRTLSNHRHSHSVNPSGKLFPCHECGKSFGSRSSQQIHVRIHTGERPYGCRFCWKAFADGGTLRKHERIHTGEKPYACSVCPRAFNQRVVLREHIRSHHSGLDAKRGTYYCTVCNMELTSSGDLIKHLIQHSDTNTAMKRQPVTGPRKYKRRRKLKPHEIARLRRESQQNTNDSDIDLSDFDMDNVNNLLAITEAPPVQNSAKQTPKPKRQKTKNNKDSESNKEILVVDLGGKTDDSLIMEIERNPRYNSIGSNSDKLWQTKMINSNTLLSNLENTLQSIDTLVVGSNGDINGGRCSSVGDELCSGERKSRYKAGASGSQRTQEVQINKTASVTGINRSRKKQEKPATKPTRPRMIHTEKSRSNEKDGCNRKRTKTIVMRTESTGLDLLHKSSILVDDYEIISPATELPKQISASPLHIKQEYEQHLHSQQHQHQQNGREHEIESQRCHSLRNGEFYDSNLLLGTSTLRKEAYEKFNPSIVNDLEEILRSPIKCERTERHRYISESSSNFIEVEPSQVVKIEPISPNLREMVIGPSTPIDSGSASKDRRTTRSTRRREIAPNRKYLEFDLETPTASVKQHHNQHLRRSQQQRQQQHLEEEHLKRKAVNNVKDPKNKMPPRGKKTKSDIATTSSISRAKPYHMSYAETLTPNDTSFSTLSAMADAENTVTAASQSDSKQRYFECEMCSAIFADRAQLLDHVPIHI